MNFYKHHLGDYAQATSHLTFVEDAAYSRLIRKYYAEERPIPADMKAAQRLVGARTREEREAVETVLHEFFELREDGWHNKRCDEEIAQAVAQAETNRRIAEEREARRRARQQHEALHESSEERATNRSTNRQPSQTPDSRLQTPERSKERNPTGYGSELGSDAQQQPPPSPADSDAPKPIVNGHPATPPTDQDNGATDEAPPAKRCPFSEIVSLYHATLPMCPAVEKLTNTRKGYIRQRWLEDLPTLDAWRNYFTDVSHSEFLTGRKEGSNGKPPFLADLEWLTRPSNFAKVAEGRYHR